MVTGRRLLALVVVAALAGVVRADDASDSMSELELSYREEIEREATELENVRKQLEKARREASSFETVANEGDAVWTRLMAHPRVQVSPHVAGWTEESYVKLSSVLADKVLAEFGG